MTDMFSKLYLLDGDSKLFVMKVRSVDVRPDLKIGRRKIKYRAAVFSGEWMASDFRPKVNGFEVWEKSIWLIEFPNGVEWRMQMFVREFKLADGQAILTMEGAAPLEVVGGLVVPTEDSDG